MEKEVWSTRNVTRKCTSCIEAKSTLERAVSKIDDRLTKENQDVKKKIMVNVKH